MVILDVLTPVLGRLDMYRVLDTVGERGCEGREGAECGGCVVPCEVAAASDNWNDVVPESKAEKDSKELDVEPAPPNPATQATPTVSKAVDQII